MFFNKRDKLDELSTRVNSSMNNLRSASTPSFEVVDGSYDNFSELFNKIYRESCEIQMKINTLNMFNLSEIELKVTRFEKHILHVIEGLQWFNIEIEKIKKFDRDFSPRIEAERAIIGNSGVSYIWNKVGIEIKASRLALGENIYRVEGPNYRSFQYKNADQLMREGLQMIDEYKRNLQAEQEAQDAIKLEQIRAENASKEQHDIEAVKKEFEQKKQAIQKELEEEKLRLKKEFDLQVESTVNEFIGKRLEQELSNQEAKIRQDFIENNHHKIEEEVNKRVDNEIRATLKRKDQVLQEQSELLKVQQKKEIEAIEGKYNKLIRGIEDHHKDVTRTLEERVRYLENRLEETIAKYEAIFQSKYQDEIESRAKELAKEFLKKEFPFE